jgi:hypothetical protein
MVEMEDAVKRLGIEDDTVFIFCSEYVVKNCG